MDRIGAVLGLLIPTVAATASGGDLTVAVRVISDGRGQEDSSQVWFGVNGPAVAGKRVQYRVRLSQAVDDTGRDLLKVENALLKLEMSSHRFWESLEDDAPGGGGKPGVSVQTRFGNPAAAAKTITLVGEIEIFLPENDPASAVRLDDVLSKAGSPLPAPGLASSGVELTVWTKAMAEAAKADKQKASSVRGLLTAPDKNIVLGVKDPEHRVVDIEFLDQAGERVDWDAGGNPESELRSFQFGTPVPRKLGLRVLLATTKALVMVPFRMANMKFESTRE